MDKIAIKNLTKQQKNIFKNALISYVSMCENVDLERHDKLTLSIITELIDSLHIKIHAPLKSNIKLKYYQAFAVQVAMLSVIDLCDEFDYEMIILSEIIDNINQKL